MAGNALMMSSLSGNSATGEIILGGADLTVNQTASTTYAGKISGTGNLVKDGTGTLILSGTNTYSGNTNVDVGTLQGDTNSIQGNVAVATDAHVIFNQASDATFANQISGAGDFTKTGAGNLTLSNTTNSYTGGTTVSSGTLTSGATGAFVDDTAYTVNSGATLRAERPFVDRKIVVRLCAVALRLGHRLTGSSGNNLVDGRYHRRQFDIQRRYFGLWYADQGRQQHINP